MTHYRDPAHAVMQCMARFAQALALYRSLSEKAPLLSLPATEVVNVAAILAFNSASIEWSKVCGSFKESTHWTHIVTRSSHGEVRAKLQELCADCGWEAYWNGLVHYRDQIAAHHDMNATVPRFPDFSKALKALDIVHAAIVADSPASLPSHPPSAAYQVFKRDYDVSLEHLASGGAWSESGGSQG